jgi:glycosyltransferase involved in cell wall biosynthesis
MIKQHYTSGTISIILVNYNGVDVLIDCLNSLEKFISQDNCEIIVVDNNSQDNSVDILNDKFPHIKLIKLPKNVGFGSGNNAGAKVAKGEFIFLLNTDTILESNILPHLIELMSENPDVGIIGPKLLFPDKSFQISFSPEISIKGEFTARKLHKNAENKNKLHIIEEDFQDIKEVDIVVGAAFFIRADLFNLLSGFLLPSTGKILLGNKNIHDDVNSYLKKISYVTQNGMLFEGTIFNNISLDIKIYSGMIDCAAKIFKTEGAMAFYKGFTPQWMRFGPFTIVQLMVWEKLRDFYGMKGI